MRITTERKEDRLGYLNGVDTGDPDVFRHFVPGHTGYSINDVEVTRETFVDALSWAWLLRWWCPR